MKKLRIIFYGGRVSGMTSLLTVLGLGHEVVCVVPVDDPVENTARMFGICVQKPKNINDDDFFNHLNTHNADMLLCCHGRMIIKKRLLDVYPCINLHPNLSEYPGAKSIERMLMDKKSMASVGAHWMTEDVDRGNILVENWITVASSDVIGVYNELYPVYAKTTHDVFTILEEKNFKKNG